MSLISFDDVSIAFGLHNLLEHATFQVEKGERICLIGRNGAGKSTLLKIISSAIKPDVGEVWRAPGLKLSYLSQEVPFAEDATVFDVVADGLPEVGRLLAEYHHVTQQIEHDLSLLKRMEVLQHELESRDGWSLNQRVENIMERLELPADARISELSGGWRRRVALGQALVSEPDLLLLDEPTNHLDVEAIQWLEEQLMQFRGGVLFVTHDRALLTRLATRILELDRGALTSWPGNYPNFLEKKAAALEDEARHNALFDKKLALEEVWVRQGIKARRTRNEGRVRALEALRLERSRRREVQGKAKLAIEEAQSSGKLVVEAKNASFGWEGKPVIRDFSVRIMRGDRIGFIGPNGAGKTTLLKLLLGDLAPTSGTVRQGTKLEVAYFDQLRAQLDPEKTVQENVADGRDFIEINGDRKHIISYLQDFLFSPERTRTPVKSLSGGERNRLLLARLFSVPANLLVLDEPTNDLDIETLELLEELLMNFGSTVLIVSHDRAFLDNVVTSTLVFEGEGKINEYVGGYQDWLRQRPQAAQVASTKAEYKPAAKAKPVALSYKAQLELEQLPAKIEALDSEQAKLSARSSDPDFYKGDAAGQAQVLERLVAVGAELETAYARWNELEAMKQGS